MRILLFKNEDDIKFQGVHFNMRFIVKMRTTDEKALNQMTVFVVEYTSEYTQLHVVQFLCHCLQVWADVPGYNKIPIVRLISSNKLYNFE